MIVFWVGLVILVFGIFVLQRVRDKHGRLSFHVMNGIEMKYKQLEKLDPAHRVMECHKFFVKALTSMDKRAENAALKIQRFADRFPNEKEIWKYHRLRNQIAHEETPVSFQQARGASEAFLKALESLL